MMNFLSARLVGYGVLLGTVGVKILTSDDAKKLYTHCTAVCMRGVDEVAKVYTTLKENCGDISADAKDINERRAQEKEARMIADAKAFLETHEEKDA